jgi:hypothetical protein
MARQAAFKQITVAHAFNKTGIVPFNPDKITPDMLEPAKNTTTQSAQPVSAIEYPNILQITPPSSPDITPPPSEAAELSLRSSQAPTPPLSSGSGNDSNSPQSQWSAIPWNVPMVASNSSRDVIYKQLMEAREEIEQRGRYMAEQRGQIALMESENAIWRKKALTKSSKKKKTTRVVSDGRARHATAKENLLLVGREKLARMKKEALKALRPWAKEAAKRAAEMRTAAGLVPLVRDSRGRAHGLRRGRGGRGTPRVIGLMIPPIQAPEQTHGHQIRGCGTRGRRGTSVRRGRGSGRGKGKGQAHTQASDNESEKEESEESESEAEETEPSESSSDSTEASIASALAGLQVQDSDDIPNPHPIHQPHPRPISEIISLVPHYLTCKHLLQLQKPSETQKLSLKCPWSLVLQLEL